MKRNWVGMAAIAVAVACGSQTAAARHHNFGDHTGRQCVTYAASHSQIALRGNAHSWWDNAAGIYERSHQPAPGAVMVMKSSGSMPMGHVAIVSRIVSPREVLLTHANWKGDGSVESNVRAIDVSPQGDWSQVRVWYAPVHAMGIKSFPTYGFILGGKAPRMATAAVVDKAPFPPAKPDATQWAIADPQP